MKLKKSHLTLFYKVLSDGKSDAATGTISLADARIRDQLASKTLFDALHDFEEARKKIYESFCKKDKDGNPEFLLGSYQFKPSEVPAVNAEVKILEDEEVEVAIDNPAKILSLMENTRYEPKVGETVFIDEILALVAPKA